MNAVMTKSGALLLLHFIVFIWGFTGILGKEISLQSQDLVWWRMAIAALSLGIWALWKKSDLAVSSQDLKLYFLVGTITAAHWICFFESIKVSNVSTALAVISTTSFFIAIVGPIIRRTAFIWRELALGILVIIGLFIIFKFEPDKTWGIIFSLMAALFAAIFSSYNSVLVKEKPPVQIAFYEMIAGVIVLTGYLVVKKWDLGMDQWIVIPGARDFGLLLILGILATAFAFVVSIEIMRVLTPFTCALTINLEPLYTILMALFLYRDDEFMSPQFYIGATLILSTVFVESLFLYKKK
ncbi:MAG: DMT family transporter, partial [Flavobacteriales bacterium]